MAQHLFSPNSTLFSGGDQGPILEGVPPYVAEAKGSLGMQRRAFYPVLDTDGTIIGSVMAAVLTSSISQLEQDIRKTFLLASGGRPSIIYRYPAKKP